MNTYKNINTICLIILTAIAVASVLTYTKAVMIPFTLALFMYLILSPLMVILETKLKAPKWIAFLITLTTFLVLSIVIVIFISTSIDSFLQGTNQYSDKLSGAAIFVANKLTGLGFDLSRQEIIEKIQNLPILNLLKGLTGSMILILSNTVLVIIFTIFLLTGESKSSHAISIIEEIKVSVSKYVGTKLLLSLITGLLVLLVYLAFGLELSIMFAILTVLLNFIPNIGSIIAVLLPIPVLLLQYGLGWETFTILGLSTLIQIGIGNIIEPKLMGESVGLHPVTILLFLTFWGFIWGIPGMFLSVPITATAKLIMNKFSLTRPVANLLAGKLE